MAKESKKKRILTAKIDFISLCPRGANTIQTVYKAEDGTDRNVSLCMLSKQMTEEGEIHAVVYAPNLRDSQGDQASAPVIKAMAYSFARDGKGVDIRHNEKPLPKSDAYIAETFIIQKSDPRFVGMKDYDGKDVDVTGGWGAVIKVESPELRRLYKTGEWQGVSMGGVMIAQEEPDVPTDAAGFMSALKEWFLELRKGTRTEETEIDMDEKTLKEILAANNAELVKGIKEALNPTKTTETPAKKEETVSVLGMGYPKPVLKANPTAEEIDRFEKEQQIYELSLAVNRSDLNSVRQFQKMAKEIAEGKESTSQPSDSGAYSSFFKSNQTVQNTQMLSAAKDDIAELILAKEAEEAKKTQK
jgi:hypothetical protein